jgi:RNA polymerase sigma-70 factor (ECF subfamily)
VDTVALRLGTVTRVTSLDARAQAFAGLIEADLLRYYAIAAAMLGDAVDAQDAVHDATVSAWQRFGDLRDHDRFGAWFDRILVNGCRDRLRHRRRHPVVDIAGQGDGALASSSDPAGAVANADAVERALRTLDADHIAVVVLRYEGDLTVPAIAERLGIAEGTVKSRLHHARRRMRTALGEPEDGR